MRRLKVNKKSCRRGLAFVLAGTIFLSMSGCSGHTGTNMQYLKKNGYTALEGRYYKGFYLNESAFEDLYVIETENDKKRIVDDNHHSVYSTKKYSTDLKLNDLYLYLSADVLSTMDANYTSTDYMNLEKVVNNETDASVLPTCELDNSNLIISPNMYCHPNDGINRNYYTSLSEIQIFFLEGKAYKITRKINENDKSMDIISGSYINPKRGTSKKTTFNYHSLDEREYEYINITDLFSEINKEEFTGEELIDLYYLIEGKTKEEIVEILKEYNESINEQGKALTITK